MEKSDMICQNFQIAFQQKNDSILKGGIQVNDVFGFVGIISVADDKKYKRPVTLDLAKSYIENWQVHKSYLDSYERKK
ncbi:MAG TPA: hypothetical protein DCQ37_25385 [Desulfobacteraceae bacterium]|nr:hypothetical protein [Desulfobacteraceae bacterium]